MVWNALQSTSPYEFQILCLPCPEGLFNKTIEGYLNGELSNLHRQTTKTRCGSLDFMKNCLLKGFTFLVHALF
jgi:hypothetical protein